MSYETQATCRAIGVNCYVFVEDSQWKVRLDEKDLGELVKTFDSSTEADSNHGIYQLDIGSFGEPPDVDGDKRIFLLILDIKDDFVGGGGSYYAGYFDPTNEFAPSFHLPSNQKEMLYIDCNPLDIKSSDAKAVIAHELQHMIHFNYDRDEEDWINEGASGYAEVLCGYNQPLGQYFLNAPDNTLTEWSGTASDYDKTQMFITYLAHRYGANTITKALVAQKATGISGVDAALNATGHGEKFQDVFVNWIVANYVNRGDLYSYKNQWLHPVRSEKAGSFPVSEPDRSVQVWGANYAEFYPRGSLRLSFTGNSTAKYRIRFVEKSQGNFSVRDLGLDRNNQGSSLSMPADTVALIVTRTSGIMKNFAYYADREVTPIVSVEEETQTLPYTLSLAQNFPNPFNASTTIAYSIPQGGTGQGSFVSLAIFNINGQKIVTLAYGPASPGKHFVQWNGRDKNGFQVASGLYIARLSYFDQEINRKLILLR